MKKGTVWSWKSLTDHCNSTSRRHFQVYSGGILKWTGGGGLTYQFLLGVWGKRISFLSQIKMMLRAGMNNFMAVGFYTLTNRMKSHCHEMFISTFFGGKNSNNCSVLVLIPMRDYYKLLLLKFYLFSKSIVVETGAPIFTLLLIWSLNYDKPIKDLFKLLFN